MENWIALLFDDKCVNSVLNPYLLLNDRFCVTLIISKLLSYGILLGAMFVKVPQILKIIKSKTGEGISFLSVLLESVAIAILSIYNARLQVSS